MNLEPRDRVVFTVLPNGTTVMRAKKRSVRELAGSLTGAAVGTVSVDDMRPD